MSDAAPEIVTDTRRIHLRRIKAGSLFKLVFIATGTVFGPMTIFFGVLALFGAHTVTVSGQPVTGIGGLIAALIMAPLFTVIFSLFGWIGAYIGIRIWGHFRPISVEYVPARDATTALLYPNNPADPQAPQL